MSSFPPFASVKSSEVCVEPYSPFHPLSAHNTTTATTTTPRPPPLPPPPPPLSYRALDFPSLSCTCLVHFISLSVEDGRVYDTYDFSVCVSRS
jgi:hypothetical protein